VVEFLLELQRCSSARWLRDALRLRLFERLLLNSHPTARCFSNFKNSVYSQSRAAPTPRFGSFCSDRVFRVPNETSWRMVRSIFFASISRQCSRWFDYDCWDSGDDVWKFELLDWFGMLSRTTRARAGRLISFMVSNCSLVGYSFVLLRSAICSFAVHGTKCSRRVHSHARNTFNSRWQLLKGGSFDDAWSSWLFCTD
jgi:hypothetical protein